MDLFREWDYDSTGTISKAEFRKAMPVLDLHVPKEEMDRLFDSWDQNGSGSITMDELHAQLRRRVEIDPSLQPGAAGEIEVGIDQKYPLR